MNQKRLTYLLFPLVAAIWAYAIYKYLFETQSDPTTPTSITTNIPDPKTPETQPQDTFTLLTNYPDPFSGASAPRKASEAMPSTYPVMSTEVQRSGDISASKKLASSPSPLAPPTNWSQYTFNGLIQRTGTAQLIGILRINGKAHYVNIGTKAQDAEVIAMSADSITLKVGEATQTIIRH